MNGFKLDPWFAPRFFIRDLWHPRSPLSSTTLVHRVFFCPSFPREKVREFERFMPDYESLTWPLGMMLPFVKINNVLMNILGWTQDQQRLLVLTGSRDTIMSVKQMRQMALQYRQALVSLIGERLVIEKENAKAEDASEEDCLVGVESSASGVRFAVVEGSGHHLQNDLQWENAANQVLKFLGQF